MKPYLTLNLESDISLELRIRERTISFRTFGRRRNEFLLACTLQLPELVERIEDATRYVIQTVRKDLFQTRILQFQHIIAVFLYGILAQERSVSLVRLPAHLYLPIVGGSAELQNRIHLPPLSPGRIQPELRASEPGHRRSIGNTIDNPDSGEIRLLRMVRAGAR